MILGLDDKNCSQVPKFVHKMKTEAASREKREIGGMTALNGELFVITCDSKVVEVFCLQSFQWLRTFELKEGCFGDITSCSRKKCLFLMNWTAKERQNEIIRFDADGKNIFIWSIKDNGGCLSITNNSYVLLTDYWKNILIEYSPRGAKIRQIDLKSDVIHPRHAIKLITGNFVVCHGDTEDQLHRVCLINANGNIIKSFGDSRGSTTSLLDYPTHLAVNKTGMIFVSEVTNRRVTILSHEFEYLSEIRVPEGQVGELKCPTRMYLD